VFISEETKEIFVFIGHIPQAAEARKTQYRMDEAHHSDPRH